MSEPQKRVRRFKRLPDPTRETIALARQAGYSSRRIARMMNLPLSTVANALRGGRRGQMAVFGVALLAAIVGHQRGLTADPSVALTVTIAQPSGQSCPTAQPAPAAAVGYNVMTLGPCVVYDTGSGGDWGSFFGASFQSSGSAYVTTNSDGSIVLAGGNQSWGGQVAAYKLFTNGFYAHATLSYSGSPCAVNGCQSVDWWGFSGSPVRGGDGHLKLSTTTPPMWVEADIIEARENGNAGVYDATILDWTRSDGQAHNYNVQTISANGNQVHDYGVLWVPATSGSQGYIQWFLDGAAEDRYTWSLGSGTYNEIDAQAVQLYLSTNNSNPMTVTGVQVWQASGSDVQQ